MDVLVVDDEPVARLATAQVLELAGYGVVLACSGEEALARLNAGRLQLVVCDWGMPGMDGLELCRALRSAPLRHYVYFLLLTSHNQPQDILHGLAAGADDYVTKPFHPAELVLRVNAGRRILRSESSALTIFALARLAESRDRETGAHLERVRSYCRLLAAELRGSSRFQAAISDEFVRLLYETSPLHDIGKVAIPDAILLKPGELTGDEFEVMKTHTVHGAETLAAAISEFPHAEFLQMAHEVALSHHERYDGQGYPQGLVGEAIPLSARIVALADVYDALRTKRVYKAAQTHAEACATILAERGRQFDPDVVEAFHRVEGGFLAVSRQYADGPEAAEAAEAAARSVPSRLAAADVPPPAAAPLTRGLAHGLAQV